PPFCSRGLPGRSRADGPLPRLPPVRPGDVWFDKAKRGHSETPDVGAVARGLGNPAPGRAGAAFPPPEGRPLPGLRPFPRPPPPRPPPCPPPAAPPAALARPPHCPIRSENELVHITFVRKELSMRSLGTSRLAPLSLVAALAWLSPARAAEGDPDTVKFETA